MFRCWLTLVLVLATLGCRHASQDIELLESELRWLEDQVYLLDEQLQLRTAELESSRRSNLALKNLLATRDAGPSRSPAGAESETPLLDSVIPRLRDPVMLQVSPVTAHGIAVHITNMVMSAHH